MTDRFIRSAQVVAQVNGLKGYEFIVIPHPVAHTDDTTLKSKAEGALDESVRLLTERPAHA